VQERESSKDIGFPSVRHGERPLSIATVPPATSERSAMTGTVGPGWS